MIAAWQQIQSRSLTAKSASQALLLDKHQLFCCSAYFPTEGYLEPVGAGASVQVKTTKNEMVTCAQAAEQQLEEVFRVAPVPEEYMKYQLHLNTGMEMEQIDQWFKDRRSRKSAVPEIKSESLQPLKISCAPCGALGVILVSIVF